jgi:hypothetical protein
MGNVLAGWCHAPVEVRRDGRDDKIQLRGLFQKFMHERIGRLATVA